MVQIEVKQINEPRDPIKGQRLQTQYYFVFLKEKEIKDLKKDMDKLRDSRKDWTLPMYQSILGKITYNKNAEFEINKILGEYEETVIAMCEKLKKLTNFNDKITQKAVTEFDEKTKRVIKKESSQSSKK